jgi:hypothetical protein
MEKDILGRYARGSDGGVIIDIAANRIEDLYNDYDKSAPYLKKDLEQDLVDYLVDSVREVGKEKFTIRFSIAGTVDQAPMSRVRMSVQKYFFYLKELELRELKRMSRTSLILFIIGIAILTLSVWMNRMFETDETVVREVFAEGLTVAAWVSLWESLATFLINWAPHRRRIRLYERIAEAPVLFREVVPGSTGAGAGT